MFRKIILFLALVCIVTAAGGKKNQPQKCDVEDANTKDCLNRRGVAKGCCHPQAKICQTFGSTLTDSAGKNQTDPDCFKETDTSNNQKKTCKKTKDCDEAAGETCNAKKPIIFGVTNDAGDMKNWTLSTSTCYVKKITADSDEEGKKTLRSRSKDTSDTADSDEKGKKTRRSRSKDTSDTADSDEEGKKTRTGGKAGCTLDDDCNDADKTFDSCCGSNSLNVDEQFCFAKVLNGMIITDDKSTYKCNNFEAEKCNGQTFFRATVTPTQNQVTKKKGNSQSFTEGKVCMTKENCERADIEFQGKNKLAFDCPNAT